MNFKNMLILMLFILAVVLSSWSILKTNKPKEPVITENLNQPDAFMENVVAVMMNKKGIPSLKIKAPKMTHYNKHDVTDIEKPDITVYRQSPEPWHIHSDYAKAIRGINEIQFWDNVVINHQKDSSNPRTTITTTALTIFPNDQIAKTNQAVTFQQPATTVHGIGMIADMNIGTIKLLSNTRGEYAPNS